MSSREAILSTIRKNRGPAAPLPNLQHDWITYADREKQFCEVLAFVGGQGQLLAADQLEAAIRKLPAFTSAKKIVSRVAGLGVGNVELDSVEEPRQLADIDLAILPGVFAVAENAAVWVSNHGIRHRAIYFLTQHLVLVVPREQLFDNLHQAYQRLSFPAANYGLFISGPSKTADIEQSLVIGAHGPRSLTVFLVAD